MGEAARQPVTQAVDDLLWEAAQAECHEFVNGETFAMAVAEDRHVTVAMNIAFTLRQHVAAAGRYFFPDVMVT